MSDAAGKVTVVLSVNKSTYTAAMQDAQKQLDTFAGKARGAGHSTVSSMQAASAAIRALHGGFENNIRAVERFVSQSKLVSGVLKSAFPVVGALALGGVVYELGQKVYKFIEAVNAVPKAISLGFRTANSAMETTNDELQVQIDKTQDRIDKLTGKQSNGLKDTLDEARVSADKLATSLQSDLDKITEITTKNSIGMFGELMTGNASTKGEAGTINSYNEQIASAGYAYKDAVRSGNTGDITKTRKALDDLLTSAINKTQQDISSRVNAQNHPVDGEAHYDQTGAISLLQGAKSGYQDIQDNLRLHDTLNSKNSQAKVLEDQHTREEQQKQAATRARELMQKYNHRLIEEMTRQHEEFDAAAHRSAKDEAQYWEMLSLKLQVGSEQYLEARKQFDASMKRVNDENATGQDSFDKTTASIGSESAFKSNLTPNSTSAIREQGKSAVELAKALTDARGIQADANSAMAESSIQYEAQTGRITQLDAATRLAALHTQEYADAMGALNEAMQSVAADPSLSHLDKLAKLTQLHNRQMEYQSQRSQQMQSDNLAMGGSNTSPMVAVRSALDDFVRSITNTSQMIGSIVQGTLSTVNQSIIGGLTGRHGSFRDGMKNITGGIASTGLNFAEGTVMKSFGFGKGKADGSAANPYHVVSVGMTGSGASSTLTQLGTAAAGAGMKSITGNSGGGLSSLVGIAGSLFSGFFANGGDPLANRPAIVGERGPEIFVPHSSGRIIPNNKIGSIGGGAPAISIGTIDARQTNPAMVASAVHHGMTMAYTGAVHTSTRNHHEQKRRRP